MKKFVLFWLLLFSIVAEGQTPGTVRYPTQLDTSVSLFELSNLAQTTLNGAINNSQTTINVASTTGFPTSGSFTVGGAEIVFYTGKTGSSFTGCIRGQDGTTAASASSGATVRMNIVARHLTALRDAIIAVQTKVGANSQSFFRIGGGIASSGNSFALYVSSDSCPPQIRWSSALGWQFSNDCTNFSTMGGAGVSTLNTLTGATQTFAVGTTGTQPNIVSSGTTHTFNFPAANPSNVYGVVGNNSQTFGGTKYFQKDSGVSFPSDHNVRLAGDATQGAIAVVAIADLTNPKFQVDYAGDLTKIKSIAYAWPTAQATEANVQVLTNNGSGVLSWARPTILVQDEGSNVNSGIQKINFTGAGVTATYDGGNNRINVSIPGSGGTLNMQAQEDSVDLTARPKFNFLQGLKAVDDSGNTRTNIKTDGVPTGAQNVVTDFGAVGDNVADDSSAIQNALNAANVSASRKVVYVPPGTYKITSQLTTYSGVTLRGEGLASILSFNVSDVAISGLSLTNTTIEKLKITGTARRMVQLGGTQLYVRDCAISGATVNPSGGSPAITAAIYIADQSSDVWITGNDLSGNGYNNASVESTEIYIASSLSPYNNRIHINNNKIVGTNTKFGIECFECFDSEAIGNQVSNIASANSASGYGILFYSTANSRAIFRNNIAQNVIKATAGSGIYLVASMYTSVTGNELYDTAQTQSDAGSLPIAAISLNGADHSTVQGNVIKKTAANGIAIVGNQTSTTLNGAINNSVTTITLNTGAAFNPLGGVVLIDSEKITYTSATATQISGCVRGALGTSAASHSDGATVSNAGPAGITVVSNTIDEATGNGGINIRNNCDECVVSGNTVVRSQRGVFANSGLTVNGVRITGNSVYDPSSNGIFLDTANDTLIQGNKIYSPGAQGVIILNGSRDQIANNIISDGASLGYDIRSSSSIVSYNLSKDNASGEYSDSGTGNIWRGNKQIVSGVEKIYEGAFSSSSGTGAKTFDWGVSVLYQRTLTGNNTFTFSNGSPNVRYSLIVLQDGTGGRTVTWPGNIKWPAGTPPTITSAANSKDAFFFEFDGTNFINTGQAYDIQ